MLNLGGTNNSKAKRSPVPGPVTRSHACRCAEPLVDAARRPRLASFRFVNSHSHGRQGAFSSGSNSLFAVLTVLPSNLPAFGTPSRWYDRADLGLRKNIVDVQFLAAMNHKSGSFSVNPRLQRHFVTLGCQTPNDGDLTTVRILSP